MRLGGTPIYGSPNMDVFENGACGISLKKLRISLGKG